MEASSDDRKTTTYWKWVAIAGIITGIGLLLKIAFWALQQKPDELTGPPVTVSVVAQLDPGLEAESLTIQFYRDGGSFLTERKLASGIVHLTAASPRETVEIVLPGSGNVRYEVSGGGWLSARAAQAHCLPKSEDENNSMFPGEPVLIRGNTTLHLTRSVPAATLHERGREPPEFRYMGHLQAKPGSTVTAFGEIVAAMGRRKKPSGLAQTGLTPDRETPRVQTPDDSVPQPVAKTIKYDLTGAEWDGETVHVSLIATNSRAEKMVPLHLVGSKIVDDLADTHEPFGGFIGQRRYQPLTRVLDVSLPHDTPVRFGVSYKGVSPTARKIVTLTLDIDGQRLTFRDIPLPARAPPEVATPAVPVQPPAPPVKPTPVVEEPKASTVIVAQTTWEGSTGGSKLVLEILDVKGNEFVAKLHWFVGGKLKMSAGANGQFIDPDKIAFAWRKQHTLFGSGYSPATYTGTFRFGAVPEINGTWVMQTGTNKGTFRLQLKK